MESPCLYISAQSYFNMITNDTALIISVLPMRIYWDIPLVYTEIVCRKSERTQESNKKCHKKNRIAFEKHLKLIQGAIFTELRRGYVRFADAGSMLSGSMSVSGMVLL